MKKDKKLIAICGHAGSGKDTLAANLTEYQNIKFSQPVKDLVQRVLQRPLDKGKDRELIIDVSWWLKGVMSDKDFERKYGFTMVTDIDAELIRMDMPSSIYNLVNTDSFWSEMTLQYLVPGGNYVFTDIRLPSEYKAVKERNAVFVKLEAPKWLCESRLMARDGAIMPGIWDSMFERYFLEWEYDIVINVMYDPSLDRWPVNVYEELVQKLKQV